MVERPNLATQHLLDRMTIVLKTLIHDRKARPVEYHGLSTFTKHGPPRFKGGFNPKGAQLWLSEIEKIFAVDCYEEHKVTYATYMLRGEAEDWWIFALQTLPATDDVISRDALKEKFLENYFLKDLWLEKAKEFLELKQGNIIIREYASKFNELMKFQPHYKKGENDEDICTQFENGLRANIQTTVGVLHITY